MATASTSCHRRRAPPGRRNSLEIIKCFCSFVKYFKSVPGASGDSIDLLPSPSRAAWTQNLPTDDGHAADEIFAFDGKTTHVEVPVEHFNHTLHEHFTIATWMKHEAHEDFVSQHRAPKEHILCMSDGDRKFKIFIFCFFTFCTALYSFVSFSFFAQLYSTIFSGLFFCTALYRFI